VEQNRTAIVGASADEESNTPIRKGPRWRIATAGIAALLPALALFAGVRDAPDSGERFLVDNLTSSADGQQAWSADGIATCTAAGTDDTAYSLSGYKLPANGSPYKINTSTFPSGLISSDVQNAINAAFSTWDAATSKSLFTNGGTTTGKPGTKDGTNAVGFGSLGNGIVGQATAWVDSKTKTITEFDFVLSTAYTWSANVGKTGDCGGDSTKFDIQSVATHEAGHTTGSNDLTNSADHAQTMYGYAAKGELYKRDVANGDKKGVTTAYGP